MLGQSEQLSLLPMYVLDVAHILFGQVHSVLPSEKLNSVYFTGLWQVHFFYSLQSICYCVIFLVLSLLM